MSATLRRTISARIYDSDRAIRLSVAPGHTAVVLGYLHEPFVRVGAAGVEVNASAPTAGGRGSSRACRSTLTVGSVVGLGMSRVHRLLRSNGDSANLGLQPRDEECR
jgi:hypothetical protein